ncbi:hypothetical protein KJ708_04585, partial [bacterium]|nr:hypothetical protein [bacterium]
DFVYDSKGNPLEENSWISGSNYATVTRNYFTNGNLQTMTDIDSVTKSFIYDVNNLFPTQESMTLPSGNTLTTTRDYNRILGKPNEVIASTSVATRTEHDGFGRPLVEYVRSSTGTETEVKSYAYEYITADVEDWENITLLKTSVFEPQPDYSDTNTTPMIITYSDASGFVLQKCAYTEDAKYRVVYSRQENGGQVSYQSEPTRENTCTFATTIPGSVPVHTAIKDYQGRVVYQESPGGDVGSPITTLSYAYNVLSNGYVQKTTTDGLGKEVQETYDYNERLVSVVDPLNNELEYEYNTVGDLEQVTINGQELVYLEYDNLGRKTLMRDANLGTWTYEYNTSNQLYKQTDSAGNYSTNVYDSAGRILTASYYLAGAILEKTVTHSYDTGDADHTVTDGELYKIEEHDGSGTLLRTTRFSYDSAYHRTEKITRTIEGVGDFEQTFSYNAHGQLESTSYPGNQNLYYDYNTIGSLEQLCSQANCDASGDIYYSIDAATGFDDQGKLLAETYGNGVVKNYSYYPNSHRMQSYVISKNGTSYSERSYEYDEYSNLTKINDLLNATGTGGLSSVAYDTLSRLTSYQPQDSATAQSLTYDNQGNILTNSKEFGADVYQYNTPKPHAVTNIGSRTFTYDDNGNMLTDSERIMTYNAQNQLTRVEMTNGNIIEYAYDYTGNRVAKAVSRLDSYNHVTQSTTHYLGEAIEIRGETIHLNIFAGSQKVATKCLGTIDAILAPMGASLRSTGIKPTVRVAVLMPYFMLAFILGIFLLMRPVSSRRSWYLVRLKNKKILSFTDKFNYYPAHVFHSVLTTYKAMARTFQETLYALPCNFAAKMVCFALVLVFSIQLPLLQAHAGDSGVPPTPQSDDTYFYYVHGDHLGSAHLLTEGSSDGGKHRGLWYNSGDLIQRIEYNPFGTEKYILNPNFDFSPEFTGQKYDIESGLYYYKSRYYNPKLARFIQADTVLPSATDYQSYNRYAYVRNNPLKYIDPSGHSFWGWFKKIAGAFIGAAVGAVASMATLGALGIPTVGGIATMLANASVAQLVCAGVVGGLVGGAIGGGISSGIKGMAFGAILGIVGGALLGGLGKGIAQLGAMGTVLALGASAGLSYATGGWEGVLLFGVGLLGAYAGNALGSSILPTGTGGQPFPGEKDISALIQDLESMEYESPLGVYRDPTTKGYYNNDPMMKYHIERNWTNMGNESFTPDHGAGMAYGTGSGLRGSRCIIVWGKNGKPSSWGFFEKLPSRNSIKAELGSGKPLYEWVPSTRPLAEILKMDLTQKVFKIYSN